MAMTIKNCCDEVQFFSRSRVFHDAKHAYHIARRAQHTDRNVPPDVSRDTAGRLQAARTIEPFHVPPPRETARYVDVRISVKNENIVFRRIPMRRNINTDDILTRLQFVEVAYILIPSIFDLFLYKLRVS